MTKTTASGETAERVKESQDLGGYSSFAKFSVVGFILFVLVGLGFLLVLSPTSFVLGVRLIAGLAVFYAIVLAIVGKASQTIRYQSKALEAHAKDLEKQIEQLSVLATIAQGLGLPPDLYTAAEIVAFNLSRGIDFTVCAHVLLQKEGTIRHFYAREDVTPSFLDAMKRRIAVSGAFQEKGIGEREVEERVFGTVDKDASARELASFLLVPVTFAGRVLGILMLGSSKRDFYTEKDRLFLEGVAAAEGIAFNRFQAVTASELGRIESLVHNMALGVAVVDTKRNVVIANPRLRSMLKEKRGGSLAFDDLKAIFGEMDYRALVDKCFEQSEAVEIQEVSADHQPIYHVFVSPLQAGGVQRQVTGVVLAFEDITAEKLLERSKSEFVSIASHQLRTPLTVTKGNVEMLLDETFGKINDEQKDILTQTATASERLIGLVNDMLDLAKIEKGDIQMKLEEIDLSAMTEEILGELRPEAKEYGVEVVHQKTEGAVPRVRADKMRLRQVIQNLIDNAIRYSRKPGKVTVSHRSTDGLVETSVADNGIGIPKEEQEKIFERFYRASNAQKVVANGSGLGLSIVKSLVEEMGGKVWFTSEVGKGTTFSFTLPAV